MPKDDLKTSSTQDAMSQLGVDTEKWEEARLLDHPSYIDLQNKLTEAETKSTEYWDKVLRVQAEMDNMQRRVTRDIANAHKFGLEKFVMELLPVVDNLERALLHHEERSKEKGEIKAIREGVRLTLQMFIAAMGKFGVEQVNPEFQPFNPELHQAVATEVSVDANPGTVLTVMQKGYTLNGRLVRPALVVVSKEIA